MQGEAISVTLSLATGPQHKNALPGALLRQGMLRRLLRFGSELEVLDPNETGALEVVRRFRTYRAVNRVGRMETLTRHRKDTRSSRSSRLRGLLIGSGPKTCHQTGRVPNKELVSDLTSQRVSVELRRHKTYCPEDCSGRHSTC